MTDNDDVSRAAAFDGTLIARMGIEMGAVEPDRAEGTMPVEGNTQPYGLLHGGASAVLAETVGSFAAMAHAGDQSIAVGVDLSITHHRAVRSGYVTAVATALHRGRTLASYAVAVTDGDGRLVASARLTCAIRNSPQQARNDRAVS